MERMVIKLPELRSSTGDLAKSTAHDVNNSTVSTSISLGSFPQVRRTAISSATAVLSTAHSGDSSSSPHILKQYGSRGNIKYVVDTMREWPTEEYQTVADLLFRNHIVERQESQQIQFTKHLELGFSYIIHIAQTRKALSEDIQREFLKCLSSLISKWGIIKICLLRSLQEEQCRERKLLAGMFERVFLVIYKLRKEYDYLLFPLQNSNLNSLRRLIRAAISISRKKHVTDNESIAEIESLPVLSRLKAIQVQIAKKKGIATDSRETEKLRRLGIAANQYKNQARQASMAYRGIKKGLFGLSPERQLALLHKKRQELKQTEERLFPAIKANAAIALGRDNTRMVDVILANARMTKLLALYKAHAAYISSIPSLDSSFKKLVAIQDDWQQIIYNFPFHSGEDHSLGVGRRNENDISGKARIVLLRKILARQAEVQKLADFGDIRSKEENRKIEIEIAQLSRMLASKTPQLEHTAKRNLSKHKAIPPKQPSSEKYRFRNPHRRIVVVSSQQDIEAQRQRAIADSKKLYVCFSRGIAPINNILTELDFCVDRIMDAERLFAIHDFTINADASMMLRKIGVALAKADSLGLESVQLVRYKELLHRAVATFTQKSLLSTSSYQSSSFVVPLNLHASCSRFRDDVACVRYVSQVVCQIHKMYGRKVRF